MTAVNGARLVGGAAAALALAWTATAPAHADDFRDGRRVLNAFVAAAQANGVSIDQRGWGHSAGVSQTGAGNSAMLNQYGRNNAGSITQTGNNNTACLVQLGRNLDGSIVQTGDGGSTGVLQTRRGAHEFPAEICEIERGRRIYGAAQRALREER
jgi:minor curlin subunit